MAKKIEEVIECMIDEQMENGDSAIIHLDQTTLDRVMEETESPATIKKLGRAVQKFAFKRGYGLDYDDKGSNNHFVIKPNGKYNNG